MHVNLREAPAAGMAEGLAGIAAYVRDRNNEVVCLNPESPAAEIIPFFPDAYTAGYHEVIVHELDIPYAEPGPPTMVLHGPCSARALPPLAQHCLDEIFARYTFLGFRIDPRA